MRLVALPVLPSDAIRKLRCQKFQQQLFYGQSDPKYHYDDLYRGDRQCFRLGSGCADGIFRQIGQIYFW